MTQENDTDLEEWAKRTGVLPQLVSPTGADEEPLSEVTVCDSISGGADYENNMPRRLGLVRKLADGTEYRAEYRRVRGYE